jgi:hypothetical protein
MAVGWVERQRDPPRVVDAGRWVSLPLDPPYLTDIPFRYKNKTD